MKTENQKNLRRMPKKRRTTTTKKLEMNQTENGCPLQTNFIFSKELRLIRL